MAASTVLDDRENMVFCVRLDKGILISGAETSVIYIDSRDDASHIDPIGAPYSTFN